MVVKTASCNKIGIPSREGMGQIWFCYYIRWQKLGFGEGPCSARIDIRINDWFLFLHQLNFGGASWDPQRSPAAMALNSQHVNGAETEKHPWAPDKKAAFLGFRCLCFVLELGDLLSLNPLAGVQVSSWSSCQINTAEQQGNSMLQRA